MADQISDSILDAILAEDPDARVACETLVTTGVVVIAGEITTHAHFEPRGIVRDLIKDIGYTDASYGFDAATCAILTSLGTQSGDIALGVDTGGAGDQGMMFGYATDETPELMPVPIMLAHGLTHRLASVRKSGQLPWLRPDGKSQVAIEYVDETPVAVRAVVLSTQHADDVGNTDIHEGVAEKVIAPVLAESDLDVSGVELHINHRSATYGARWVAKNLVAAGLAKRCEVQLAYAIGVADPVSVMVETFGTGTAADDVLQRAVREVFDLTPIGIIRALELRKPIYRMTAAYGHFGRKPEDTRVNGVAVRHFTWEDPTRAADLREAVRNTR
jgi:S-adenosylmethionine synthetase